MADGKTESVTLALTDDMSFDADFVTGHQVTFDAAREEGGENRGPRPTQVLLASFAACTAMDVIAILRKMRQPVEDYRLVVEGERATEHPRVFTHIKITHMLVGNISEERLAHAIELSDERYCSVGAMLRQVATIETTFEVRRT
jgi:putative redox protein